MIRVRAATQATLSSRTFQMRPSPPPGFSTRWISASAAGLANQWKAWAQTIASTAPSPAGSARRCPASPRSPGLRSSNCARIAATGSTAITAAPVALRCGRNFPVPAPRSSTVLPAPSARSSRSHSMHRGGIFRPAAGIGLCLGRIARGRGLVNFRHPAASASCSCPCRARVPPDRRSGHRARGSPPPRRLPAGRAARGCSRP